MTIPASPDQVRAYLVSLGRSEAEIQYVHIGDLGSGPVVEAWDVPGLAAPTDSDLPTEAEAATILAAARRVPDAMSRAAALLAEVRPWLDLKPVLTAEYEAALDAFLADVAEALQTATDGGDPTWPEVPEALT